MKIFQSDERRRAGFTIVETLIVLFIILAFLGMSVPFFRNFAGGTELKIAANEVKGMLVAARSYAISRNEDYEVLFDTAPTPNSYSIFRSAAPGVPVDKTIQLPSGVTFTAPATIRFAPNGGISINCLTDPPVVTVNSSSGSRIVSVEKATGMVTIQ